MAERRFHLRDRSGNSLDERYGAAAEEISRSFGRFPEIDPADLDNVLEEVSETVSTQEELQGKRLNLVQYIRVAFRNRVRDLRRTPRYRAKLREMDLDPAATNGVANDLINCSQALIGKEKELALTEAVSAAVSRLSARDKEIVLASIAGYSTKDLAKMYRTSEGNISVVRSRFRKDLRARLRQHL